MRPIPNRKEIFSGQSKETTRTKRENRRWCRSVHQARRNRPAAWLVLDRFKPDHRDCNVLEVGDSDRCCHRRRWQLLLFDRRESHPETRIRLLEALTDKFGEELVVFLDRAGYFYARDIWVHVSDYRETETIGDCSISCIRGDDLEVWCFPSKLPKLNAVGECWDQLQEWFNYRLVPGLSTLKEYILRGLSAINEPNIWAYLIGKYLS